MHVNLRLISNKLLTIIILFHFLASWIGYLFRSEALNKEWTLAGSTSVVPIISNNFIRHLHIFWKNNNNNNNNNCTSIAFNFPWEGYNTQGKWKAMVMQNFFCFFWVGKVGGGGQGALWEMCKCRILFTKRVNQGREKGHLFWTG